jgi:ligand-binding sensor domain-containing protein
MRKLLRLYILLAAIPLLIACEKAKNSGEIDIYEVNHWPIVKTLEITDITDTSATLNAAVNAFSLPTIVTFEYGNTTSYDYTVTADQSPVTGSDITNVSAIISGLLPCMTYHVRVKAENSIWENFYGSDKTFTSVEVITNYNNGNSGLPSNIVGPIVIDGSNNIWMASSYMSDDVTGTIGSGVSKFDGTNWTTYTTADGLAYNEVCAIAIDAQGNKWFGTWGGGVSKFDGINWTTYTNPNATTSVYNYVTSIAIDAQGNKWFGTWGGGVSKFDGTSWTTYSIADGLLADCVYSVVIDAQGIKWIGTQGGGVSKFDDKSWTNYNTANSGIAYDQVCSIAIDAQGNKWFGTTLGGVSKFDGNNWITNIWDGTVPILGCLPGRHTSAIVLEANGNIWFGTENGAAKFDGTNWTTYITANGVGLGLVCAIAIDTLGNKWLGTYGGGVYKLSCDCK